MAVPFSNPRAADRGGCCHLNISFYWSPKYNHLASRYSLSPNDKNLSKVKKIIFLETCPLSYSGKTSKNYTLFCPKKHKKYILGNMSTLSPQENSTK